jgi:hypothetical protein
VVWWGRTAAGAPSQPWAGGGQSQKGGPPEDGDEISSRRRKRGWEKDLGRMTPGEGVMHSPHGVPLLHWLVVSVCQSPSNRVEVTGDDNRAGWDGWALDLPRNPSSKASTALLDAGLHLRAPVWWSWGRALIGLSF